MELRFVQPCSKHKLVKLRTLLASLNHCAIPFLSSAAANLCWYYCNKTIVDGNYSNFIPKCDI